MNTAKPSRRYQVHMPYAYCTEDGCIWTDSGTGSPHSRLVVAEAELHHITTASAPWLDDGHQVRVLFQRELIVGQARPLPQPCIRHPAEDAPAGVLGCCAGSLP